MSLAGGTGRVQAPLAFGWTGRGDWHAPSAGPGAGEDQLQGPPRTERAVAGPDLHQTKYVTCAHWMSVV